MQAIVKVRWPLTYAVLVASTLLVGLATPASTELPDHLTDEAFWKRIIDSSEGTGVADGTGSPSVQ
jgi:hypothetical protein